MFFVFLFICFSLPQLRHISYVKIKLKPWIPQVFCHRVCLLIQSASMDPFFAHYQDQDWKKRDREGTFREGAEITQVKRDEYRAQSGRQTRQLQRTTMAQKAQRRFGLEALLSLTIHFLISAAGGETRRHNWEDRVREEQVNTCKGRMQSSLSGYLWGPSWQRLTAVASVYSI